MTILYWIAGISIAVIVGALGWALSLPQEVSASRSTIINAPLEAVFERVTNIAAQPGWRSDVEQVEVSDDQMSWVEHTSQGLEVRFRETRKEPGLFALSYASPQGFSGSWEGRFEADGPNTKVEISETTRTHGLVPRVMARIFAPAGAHIDLYISDLIASTR